MRRLRLRALSEAERTAVEKLAHSRTAPARQVERARIVWQASQDQMAPAIAAALRLTAYTVRDWVKRFNAQGLAGLEDQPRAGRPPTYTPEQVATVIATALTDPKRLDLPFGSLRGCKERILEQEIGGLPITPATAVLDLEKAGFSRDQVKALARYLDAQAATRADLVEGRPQGRDGAGVRAEMAELRNELKALEQRRTIKLGGMIAASVVLVTAAVKLL